MQISSLNVFNNSNLAFEKDKRGQDSSNCILAVQTVGKEKKFTIVNCKQLTYFNFFLKFLGLGPLAKKELRLCEIRKELTKNWTDVKKEMVFNPDLKSYQTILQNIEKVFQKCSKTEIFSSHWEEELQETQKEWQLNKIFNDLSTDVELNLPANLQKVETLGIAENFKELLLAVCNELPQENKTDTIKELLKILFSDERLLTTLLKDENKYQIKCTIIAFSKLIHDKEEVNLFEKLDLYRQFIHHEIFERIGSCKVTFDKFLENEFDYTDNLFQQLLDLPEQFFQDSSFIHELMDSYWFLPLIKNHQLLSILKTIPSHFLKPQIINEIISISLAAIPKSSWRGDITYSTKVKLIEDYYEYSNYRANPLKQKLVKESCNHSLSELCCHFYSFSDAFHFLFNFAIASEKHFSTIRNLFDPVIQELEKKGAETAVYHALISLIMEKPLQEQLEWAEACVTSIGGKYDITLTKKEVKNFKKISLQEFQKNIKIFEKKPCLSLILHPSFATLKKRGLSLETIKAVVETDSTLDARIPLGIMALSILDTPAPIALKKQGQCLNLGKNVIELSKLIGSLFFTEMQIDPYNLAFKDLIKQNSWSNWKNSLGEEEWDLSEEELPDEESLDKESRSEETTLETTPIETAKLSSLLCLKDKVAKEAVETSLQNLMNRPLEGQQDVAPFIEICKIIFQVVANQKAERREATLAVFDQMLENRPLDEVLNSNSFKVAHLLEVINQDPSLETLKKVLEEKNQE